MTGDLSASPLSVALAVSMVMLAAAFVLAAMRLIRGPSMPDRLIALDLGAILLLGLVAVHVVRTGYEVLLNVATGLALVAFLGTVALARYVESRGERR
jgi:multicomponent Na+:H+ antiporter subunit F